MVDKFLIYDLIFLVIFVLFVSFFLYRGKKNIKRDGLLLLYRTSWGMKLIDRIGKKYPKTIRFLSFVSVGLGFVLMFAGLYLVWMIVEVYLFRPDIVQAIKVPPITPLVPYLTSLPSLNFLPPLYVTYWIAIIAIAAIPHEFFHGIFMRRYNIKINSTGFGFFPYFLPVFLAAFVEQDEKSMNKASKFEQMAVLGAGTFANVLTAIFFFFVFWAFFVTAFAPAGIIIEDYAYSLVEISGITMINGIQLNNPTINDLIKIDNESKITSIEANGESYAGIKATLGDTDEYIVLYDDAPAINAGLTGAITEINGEKITSVEKLSEELGKYSPGDEVEIKTINTNDKTSTNNIILGEHPQTGNGFLGVKFPEVTGKGIVGKTFLFLSAFKKPEIYYKPVINGFSIFIYNLLLWILLASVSVAVMNMLPVGIFDGGRFFYLTVWGLTGNEKIAGKTFSWITYFFLFLLLLIMIMWAFTLF